MPNELPADHGATDRSDALTNAEGGGRIADQLAFLTEIDALKTVLRQSTIADGSRRENSAEHSWHLAMFALILAPDAGVDVAKVVSMLLVHDIVEIDAGDAPIHGTCDWTALEAAERRAAERLFGLLPETQSKALTSLWREFEEAGTPEARFAKALDRLQPLLLNTLTGGGTWRESGVSEDQVHQRYGPTIAGGSHALWAVARELVRRHFADADPSVHSSPPSDDRVAPANSAELNRLS